MKLFDSLDAIPPLSPEERQIVDSVKSLARDRIAPHAEDYDRTAEFPWDNLRAINALGLNAMFVPETYGGAGLSYAAYLACVREISAACAATGSIWATNFHALKPLIDFGTDEQKQRLLPRVAEGAIGALCITEPEAGSDATGMTTRFTPEGDDTIVVSGGKTFISNGSVADLYLVFGKWSEIGDGRNAFGAQHLCESRADAFDVLNRRREFEHEVRPTRNVNREFGFAEGGGRRTPIRSLAVSKLSVIGNFVQSLLAVLLGNAAYYVLMPSLPPAARHRLFQVDLGLVVDFWFCVAAFGLIRTARWWRHRRSGSPDSR